MVKSDMTLLEIEAAKKLAPQTLLGVGNMIANGELDEAQAALRQAEDVIESIRASIANL